MSTPVYGAGFAPAGVCPAGYGTPASGNGSGTVTFANPQTGAPQGSRLIDQATKQYIVGSNGRVQGMSNVAQMVQIAASTAFNSSAVRGLGLDSSAAQTIDAGTQNALLSAYRNAFADLINRKLITLVDVVVTPFPTDGAYVLVKWKDLTTGLEQSLRV